LTIEFTHTQKTRPCGPTSVVSNYAVSYYSPLKHLLLYDSVQMFIFQRTLNLNIQLFTCMS